MATQSGFFRRKAKKLSLEAFVHTALLSVSQPVWSLANWAALLSVLQRQIFSKQALHKRCHPRAVNFVQALIAGHLGRAGSKAGAPGLFQSFSRVLLQDSTTLPLCRALAAPFPGSGNQSPQKSSALKVQAVLELLTQRWICFQLSPFTRTDQAAAADCLAWIQPGDLLLRDLGYAVIEVWQALINRGAYFVSRLRQDFVLFDAQADHPLDLLQLLNSHPVLSLKVRVGREQKLPLRLVALRLPPQLAAQRRRRVRANAKRDRRLRLSDRYLQLQDWTILLTNVQANTWSAQKVLEAYQCRWHIETVFKAWKSCFRLDQLPRTSNPEQLLLMVCFKLLAIALLQQWLQPDWSNSTPQPWSPLRLAAYFASLLPLILWLPDSLNLNHLDYFCRYESRPSRPNFFQHLALLG